jgi:hypothetical protein
LPDATSRPLRANAGELNGFGIAGHPQTNSTGSPFKACTSISLGRDWAAVVISDSGFDGFFMLPGMVFGNCSGLRLGCDSSKQKGLVRAFDKISFSFPFIAVDPGTMVPAIPVART